MSVIPYGFVEGIPPEDLQEIRRRLDEEYDLLTCGYDPVYPDRREPWIKCHAGDVLLRREALKEIAEGRY